MLTENLLLGMFGLASGVIASGGVFALLTAVGVITRLAGKSHTANYVVQYENTIILGGICGNIMTIFYPELRFGVIGAVIFGLFSGIFVGCLATSLAESLNATAVFGRRIKLKLGMEYIVLSLAIGKMFGSLLYYCKHL